MKFLFIALGLSLNTLANLPNEKVKLIMGEEKSISELASKGGLLVVNIATRCGLTGQLDDLQRLYNKYKSKGLVVLGVPSNDFMGQTPEGNKELAKFCRLNYGVDFPLAKKRHVKGEKISSLYRKLLDSDPQKRGSISWNFEKFLLNKEGRIIGRYNPTVTPLDSKIAKDIENLLKK